MKWNVILVLLCVSLVSCYDKHLDEKVFKGKDFTVSWYHVSTITTLDYYIDLEKWGHTVNIMKSPSPALIYDIVIKGDTVIIKTTPRINIHELIAKKYGVVIRLDNTITTYEYMKKYSPENAIDYIHDTLH